MAGLAHLYIFYDKIGAAVELEIGAAALWTGVLEFVAGELSAAILAEDCGFFDFGVHLYTGK